MKHIIFRLAFAGLLCSLVLTSDAATLGPTATLLPPSGDYLSPSSDLGFPGTFWNMPLLQWNSTGPAVIEVPVITSSEEAGVPTTHNVFVTAQNMTPDYWHRFVILIDGPAVFNTVLLPSLFGVPSSVLPTVNSQAISFDGLDWPSSHSSTESISVPQFGNFSFSLDVFPPDLNEPVVITFQPIPEPSTAMLVAGLSAAFVSVRRRRSVNL